MKSRTASRARAGTTLSIDFSGVETFKRLRAGEHLLKVIEVTKEKGDKGSYLAWKLEAVEGGGQAFHNTSLAKQSLWSTKAWLEALAIEVPDDEMELDLEDMIDKEVMVQIEMETYDNKLKPRIVDFWPAEEGERGEDAGERSSGSKKKPTEDQLAEMDGDELAAVIKKHKLDVDPEEFPTDRKLRQAVIEALEEGDGDAGKPSRSGKNKKKPSEEDVDDMGEEELEDVIKQHDLDVDLAKYKTLGKMRTAVKEALEG